MNGRKAKVWSDVSTLTRGPWERFSAIWKPRSWNTSGEVSPRSLTARDVDDAIGEACDVQYITLVTVLNNLCRKRLLKRTKAGRAFTYVASMERDEFLRKVYREVFSGIVDLGLEVAVSSFVDVLSEMAPAEIRRLKRTVAQHKRRGNRK